MVVTKLMAVLRLAAASRGVGVASRRVASRGVAWRRLASLGVAWRRLASRGGGDPVSVAAT